MLRDVSKSALARLERMRLSLIVLLGVAASVAVCFAAAPLMFAIWMLKSVAHIYRLFVGI